VSADGTGIRSRAGGADPPSRGRAAGAETIRMAPAATGRGSCPRRAPGTDSDLVTVDIAATIVTSCSAKEQTTPTWKKIFGL